MKTFDVEVYTTVRVTVDEAAFTPAFMEEYRRYFRAFETVEDHVAFVARLYACGIIEDGESLEGYEPNEGFGFKFELIACDAQSPEAVGGVGS